MFVLNKIVGVLMNPLMEGILIIVAGLCLQFTKRRRLAIGVNGFAALWFWIWSTHALYMVLGLGLEKQYPPIPVDQMPQAEAIVILGGGMGANTNFPYAEMWSSADRVWHAARLYHAKCASTVIVSGMGEEKSSVPLLRDLGVPQENIIVENKAVNTEENAIFVSQLVNQRFDISTDKHPSILLVTSGWHMRRALLNFSRQSLHVIPAATDHEALINCNKPLLWSDVIPSYDRFSKNCVAFKEILGYWLYRLKYVVWN